MNILKTILLGIIEGITEWLPISSTGHLILADEFIRLDMSKDFKDMFEVVIQLGAILAVVVLFWKKIWPFTLQKSRGYSYITKGGGYIKKDIMDMWFKIVVAIFPLIALYLLKLKQYLDDYSRNPIVVSVTLILYGILFIVVERINRDKKPKIDSIPKITYKTALLIGLFQMLSVIPGTSRSGATILGAIILGVSRIAAAEFCFYMAVPVMFGASLVEIKDFGFHLSGTEIMILAVGMVTAFLVSVVVLKFLMNYIKKHDFSVFGYYRIVLGLLVIGYFALIA